MGRRTETDPKTGKPVVSSAGKFMGINTIFGRDGEQGGPYMTRAWFWRLRLHTFHRPDQDEDCHDHPWDFWTFPLVSYVEEVAIKEPDYSVSYAGPPWVFRKTLQIVPAWRLSFRPATHCHRVLGAYQGNGNAIEWDTGDDGTITSPNVNLAKKIVTIVWISKPKRAWGFLKNREGEWCWVAWRDYIFNGGKDGPCQ